VYSLCQVVKTMTIILNNPVFLTHDVQMHILLNVKFELISYLMQIRYHL